MHPIEVTTFYSETTTHSKKKIINLQGKKMIDTNGGFLLEDDPPAQVSFHNTYLLSE